MRIVSLLPSATEIICQLGLIDSLVGVTHECDFPSAVRQLPKVTRTLIPVDASSREIDLLVRERLKTERALYSLDFDVLSRMKPDLIVTQALCDVCAVAEAEVKAAACSLPGTPRVLNLEPMSLEQVLSTLLFVGEAANVTNRAQAIVSELRERVAAVVRRSEAISKRPRVVMLEWLDPPFSSGHWSPELIEIAGGTEQLGRAGLASRTLDWNDVAAADPDAILIACCGFDVARTMTDVELLKQNVIWNRLKAVANDRVYIVDGSAYFNRPGPRLVESLELVAHALHPEIHPRPSGIEPAKQLKPGY